MSNNSGKPFSMGSTQWSTMSRHTPLHLLGRNPVFLACSINSTIKVPYTNPVALTTLSKDCLTMKGTVTRTMIPCLWLFCLRLAISLSPPFIR